MDGAEGAGRRMVIFVPSFQQGQLCFVQKTEKREEKERERERGTTLPPIEQDKQTRLCSKGALPPVRCLLDVS